MKKLIYLTLIMAALLACSENETEDPEATENYLENTKWQAYTVMLGNETMVAKYLTFKEDGSCDYVDSVNTSVITNKYFYDAVNGESFNGAYYTTLYNDENKTNEYQVVTVDESLDKLHFYWVLGDIASVIRYKRVD